MKAGIKISGLEEVMIALRYQADVVQDKARKVMHRTSDAIVELAQLQAPVDKHNLEQSIHKEVDYEDKGRLMIDIVAGGEVNGVDVDAYVTQIHEDYSSMHPGKNTLAKMAANPGVLIGEKFLTRAYDAYAEKLEAVMITDVNQDVKL